MCNVSIPANADNKVVAGENAIVMTNEMYPVIDTMLESFVESGYPMGVIDTDINDNRLGHFGVALWSRDGKQLEVSTFYLGVDGQCNLAKDWDMAVCRLPQMFNERWGCVPYVEASSQIDIENKWYESVYNN